MSWRIVVISNKCKLTYKNNHLVIKNSEINLIHLSEINTIVIDAVHVSITGILVNELMNRKIKVVFCDERHNPKGEIMQYYGSHNSSKKIYLQSKWEDNVKNKIWDEIVKQKIFNQSSVLKKYHKDNWQKLLHNIEEVHNGDITNREGHSAKVYFNSLFGMDFNRDECNDINSALDYGYSILLSNFNREVVSNGNITQLGIHHKNEFNHFNLSCDLMEPFRPIVDDIVYCNKDCIFDKEYKIKLINILNSKIFINNKIQYLPNAINIFI
ncbi:MAG: type II CRISPR-associated endonuclease Cas1, partial [Clostridiales bacterium]|nr:type II CRISPR-associated endonuclease Cas1 [Clostridiales bacterium]